MGDMMVKESKLVVIVMEDVGPACSLLEMYARKYARIFALPFLSLTLRDEVSAAFEQLSGANYIHGDDAPQNARSGGAIPSSSSSSMSPPPSTMTAEAKSTVRLIDFGPARLVR